MKQEYFNLSDLQTHSRNREIQTSFSIPDRKIPLFRQSIVITIHVRVVFVQTIRPESHTSFQLMGADTTMFYAIGIDFYVSILPGL
jgi:hypothetical protein